MAGLRFRLDLFIPEDLTGTLVAGVMIPTALATRVPAIRQAIRDLKAYAVQVPTSELTIRAVFHKCYHDEEPPRPCEPEQDI